MGRKKKIGFFASALVLTPSVFLLGYSGPQTEAKVYPINKTSAQIEPKKADNEKKNLEDFVNHAFEKNKMRIIEIPQDLDVIKRLTSYEREGNMNAEELSNERGEALYSLMTRKDIRYRR
jgi:hypothetical protein